MSTTVLKPFTSATRRFAVGDPVNAGDDLSPHSFEDLKAGKFIGTAKAADKPAGKSEATK